jgi:hypothetical protein
MEQSKNENVEPTAWPGEGVWVAFNSDGSAFVPFATEIEALRYALPYAMAVTFARYGDDEWMQKAR